MANVESNDLTRRVEWLEHEVTALRSGTGISAPASGALAVAQKVGKIAVSNWVLFSFVAALLTAGYVKYRFGIDYFEGYLRA